MRTRSRPVLAAVLLGGLVGGLGSGCTATGSERELTVLAAASLTGSFTELADRFEAAHDGVEVRLAFDSSATLAEQVNQGAPADVLATADERTMRSVVDQGHSDGDPQAFATNRLTLVVPRENAADIDRVGELDDASVEYVVCVPSAPCGALAEDVLAAAGITAPPASEEVDVKAVLSKVVLGEADAGVVYATDARAAGHDVRAFRIPAAADAVTTYLVTALDGAAEPQLAEDWLDLVGSATGRRVLADAGFGAP